MKVMFFIDQISDDPRIGEAVEHEGKIWLLAPVGGQIQPPDKGPYRLIRLDSLPKFFENTPGHYILNTPLPKELLLDLASTAMRAQYETKILPDLTQCRSEPRVN